MVVEDSVDNSTRSISDDRFLSLAFAESLERSSECQTALQLDSTL